MVHHLISFLRKCKLVHSYHPVKVQSYLEHWPGITAVGIKIKANPTALQGIFFQLRYKMKLLYVITNIVRMMCIGCDMDDKIWPLLYSALYFCKG